MLSGPAIEHAAMMYDRDGSGSYDFREVCCLLAAVTTATINTKLRLMFDVYDLDGSGYLESEETLSMALALARAIFHTSVTDDSDSIDIKAKADEFISRFTAFDRDSDGKISREEFLIATQSDSNLLYAFGVGTDTNKGGAALSSDDRNELVVDEKELSIFNRSKNGAVAVNALSNVHKKNKTKLNLRMPSFSKIRGSIAEKNNSQKQSTMNNQHNSPQDTKQVHLIEDEKQRKIFFPSNTFSKRETMDKVTTNIDDSNVHVERDTSSPCAQM